MLVLDSVKLPVCAGAVVCCCPALYCPKLNIDDEVVAAGAGCANDPAPKLKPVEVVVAGVCPNPPVPNPPAAIVLAVGAAAPKPGAAAGVPKDGVPKPVVAPRPKPLGPAAGVDVVKPKPGEQPKPAVAAKSKNNKQMNKKSLKTRRLIQDSKIYINLY